VRGDGLLALEPLEKETYSHRGVQSPRAMAKQSRFVDNERTVKGGWKPLPAHIQAALQKKRDRKSKSDDKPYDGESKSRGSGGGTFM
jgi:hypothetical protein